MASKSLNRVQLIGNLGKDPEVKYTPQGTPVAKLTIATNERFKDKAGEWQDRTEWHNVVLWQRLAEIAGEYLKKGRSVYVEGRLKTRKWTDKDGAEKYSTEIIANDMQMLGGREGMGQGAPAGGEDSSYGAGTGTYERPAPASRPAAAAANRPAAKSTSGFDNMDDDIPF